MQRWMRSWRWRCARCAPTARASLALPPLSPPRAPPTGPRPRVRVAPAPPRLRRRASAPACSARDRWTMSWTIRRRRRRRRRLGGPAAVGLVSTHPRVVIGTSSVSSSVSSRRNSACDLCFFCFHLTRRFVVVGGTVGATHRCSRLRFYFIFVLVVKKTHHPTRSVRGGGPSPGRVRGQAELVVGRCKLTLA